MMTIRVIAPGLMTTIQDKGRQGLKKYGVVVGGAMDPFARRVANLLVGNDEDEAVLEMTMAGPTLLFERDALIAICGGSFSPKVNGFPVGQWRPIFVQRGSKLSFGVPNWGCRAYLAVAGGFCVPQVLGSKSTYLRAGIGGLEGRALQKGDVLKLGRETVQGKNRRLRLAHLIKGKGFAQERWRVGSDLLPAYAENPEILVLRGGQFAWFSEESRRRFFMDEYVVTSRSDRMGYRLSGPQLTLKEPRELISEAVTVGTVQVPAGGEPIILMADCQTTGGYPKIAQIITADLPKLAQLKPGAKIRFREISIAEAQKLYREQEKKVQWLKRVLFLGHV
jgi:antagonist of KipI